MGRLWWPVHVDGDTLLELKFRLLFGMYLYSHIFFRFRKKKLKANIQKNRANNKFLYSTHRMNLFFDYLTFKKFLIVKKTDWQLICYRLVPLLLLLNLGPARQSGLAPPLISLNLHDTGTRRRSLLPHLVDNTIPDLVWSSPRALQNLFRSKAGCLTLRGYRYPHLHLCNDTSYELNDSSSFLQLNLV